MPPEFQAPEAAAANVRHSRIFCAIIIVFQLSRFKRIPGMVIEGKRLQAQGRIFGMLRSSTMAAGDSRWLVIK